MDTDWVDDDSLSREEMLARFRALNPQPTEGPRLPGGGYIVTSIASRSVGSSPSSERQRTVSSVELQAQTASA